MNKNTSDSSGRSPPRATQRAPLDRRRRHHRHARRSRRCWRCGCWSGTHPAMRRPAGRKVWPRPRLSSGWWWWRSFCRCGTWWGAGLWWRLRGKWERISVRLFKLLFWKSGKDCLRSCKDISFYPLFSHIFAMFLCGVNHTRATAAGAPARAL